jgi:hypothetical protein
MYFVEYYLRAGVLMFHKWNDEEEDDLETMLRKRSFQPFHFISVDNYVRVYESLASGRWGWTAKSESGVRKWLPENDKLVYYPSARTFNGTPAQIRSVFPDLNTNDEDGIYGFRSANVTRSNKPLIEDGAVAKVLVNVVKRINKNYPDEAAMNLNTFKVFDENKKQDTLTKGNKMSSRTKPRGLACSSSPVSDTNAQVARLMETLKNNWDFFLEHMSKDEFLKAVNKALGERKERDNACFRLESLLFIADYYQIQGKKWYLNTLETEFYRPVVPPKK